MSGERFTGYLACTGENRRFRLENQMVRAIPLGPVRQGSENNLSAVTCGDAFFFNLFRLFSTFRCNFCSQPFSHHVKFYSFMFVNKIPTRLVCVNGKPSL